MHAASCDSLLGIRVIDSYSRFVSALVLLGLSITKHTCLIHNLTVFLMNVLWQWGLKGKAFVRGYIGCN